MSGLIATIPNRMPSVSLDIRHEVPLPSLCPATGNPQPGSSLSIRYRPTDRLLDVFGITALLNEYVGHTTIRDVEYMIQHLARRLSTVLTVPVMLEAEIVLDIGQRLVVQAQVSPS